MTMVKDLAKYRIPGTCEAFYIPDFVTEEEEDYLIRKIRGTPHQRWKQLANRRLQLIGGEIMSNNVLIPQPMPSFINTYPNLTARLRDLGVFTSSPHGEPNHIILNEYLAGQGIMPHEDGPSYHPVVATLSLHSHAVFHYYRYAECEANDIPGGIARSIDPTPAHSVFLEPRSLVITTASLYTSHLHGIQEKEGDAFIPNGDGPPVLADLGVPVINWNLVAADHVKEKFKNGGILQRGIRYSLTCRDVERVASSKAIYGY